MNKSFRGRVCLQSSVADSLRRAVEHLAMSTSEQAETSSEIERGFQFLATLSRGGKVYSLLLPILSDLKVQSEREKLQQDASTRSKSTLPVEEENCHKSIVLLIHKAMCEEKFVCIVEKASSVPGFAAPIRGEVYMMRPIEIFLDTPRAQII